MKSIQEINDRLKQEKEPFIKGCLSMIFLVFPCGDKIEVGLRSELKRVESGERDYNPVETKKIIEILNWLLEDNVEVKHGQKTALRS